MQITLRGIKAGMNECVTLVIEATPHSRVGAVATNFAATHLRARGIVSISRDTVAVDPTAVVDDALERDAVYDVVLKPDRDEDASTASPYWVDAQCLDQIRWRDPRSGVACFDEAPCERFDVGDPRGYAYLEEHGYVVFREVLAEPEVRKATALFWDFMESRGASCVRHTDAHGDEEIRRVDRRDPGSWHWVANPINGLIGVPGIGQSAFLWYARTRPRVLEAFSRLWDLPEDTPEARAAALLTSFDGCCAFRPWRVDRRWRTLPGWWHVDQNSRGAQPRGGKRAVQGLVSLTQASPATGGFCVIPGSHLRHDRVCAASPSTVQGPGHFVPLRGDSPEVRGATARFVACEAGDLICWDSRTIHCSLPAFSENGASGSDFLRLCAYVCMSPRRVASPDVLRQRLLGFHAEATTSHWPDDWAVSIAGAGYRRELRDLPCPRLAARLVGWTDEQVRQLFATDDRPDADMPAHPQMSTEMLVEPALVEPALA